MVYFFISYTYHYNVICKLWIKHFITIYSFSDFELPATISPFNMFYRFQKKKKTNCSIRLIFSSWASWPLFPKTKSQSPWIKAYCFETVTWNIRQKKGWPYKLEKLRSAHVKEGYLWEYWIFMRKSFWSITYGPWALWSKSLVQLKVDFWKWIKVFFNMVKKTNLIKVDQNER